MPSAKKKNKLGRLTGKSDKEREALQLKTYLAHLQNNKTLQGIAVSTDSIASPEQRTKIFSLMKILDEEGVLKKVIFYQLQNDRSVDLGKSSFSNPGSTPATQAYSQKAQTALRDLYQIVETFIPEDMELDDSKAITNVPIHTNGSAQMQYCAVVDEGNFVRLGRFHSTCTSAKIHLEAQEAIIMSKLGVISSVKYGCEISVSKFVNCESFHRVCSIRNIVLVTSMYKFTESHPSHSHKQHDSVNAAFKISKHLKRLCKYFLSGRWC